MSQGAAVVVYRHGRGLAQASGIPGRRGATRWPSAREPRMSEWKTLRVRAATLEAVKARASAAGTNATAWADEVLLASVQGECPRAACGERGPVGQACPVDPHLKFKAAA